jgi:hypothetical protein
VVHLLTEVSVTLSLKFCFASLSVYSPTIGGRGHKDDNHLLKFNLNYHNIISNHINKIYLLSTNFQAIFHYTYMFHKYPFYSPLKSTSFFFFVILGLELRAL